VPCSVTGRVSAYSTLLHRSCVIDVPSKIWRPKPATKYVPLDYGDDIDDDLLVCTQYGRTVRRTPATFSSARTDIHAWDSIRDTPEFTKDFRIGSAVEPATRTQIASLVQKYWDVFYAAGVSKTVLGFEFAIDTGGSQPVCCRKPTYGPHESRIILQQQQALLANGWIRECYGPWGSLVVLAPKPHQEDIEDINDFVWRFCVSYRKLNSVTLAFEYPIPRCEDAIENFGDSAGKLYFISLDARSGYHQIAVRECDQDKLAFFGADGRKWTYPVMPFGTKNAPGVYTCMMHFMSTEWNELFAHRFPEAELTDDRVIIDDIFLLALRIPDLLNYAECCLIVCQKYRLSLKLSKCDFLKERVEYVGHDLTSDGNCPSQSKFAMIDDWPLPATGQALHSLVQLCNFYNKYCPWLEIRLKPLRLLIKRFHRKTIPIDEWTPALRALFAEVKAGVTSSPCLARYDSSKPTFLKTDWSADGFGAILMQPDDSPASVAATAKLLSDGICDFDLLKSGARLRPCGFLSRACTEQERHFHSFVGEAACGRWSICKYKKYLWGCYFYWICDCSAIQEVLEYDGPIHVVRRWAQELLGYHFAVIHRPARMMQDVDALSRRYSGLVHQYMTFAATLSSGDRARRPAAYDPSVFPTYSTKCPSQLPSPAAPSPIRPASTQPVPILHTVALTSRPAAVIPQITRAPRTTIAHPPPALATRSFATSALRCESGLSDSALIDICLSWLSVDPGIPSLALAFPDLNPLLCIAPIIMVPTIDALRFTRTLIPPPIPVFVSSLDLLHCATRPSLARSTAFHRSMHRSSALPLPTSDQFPPPPLPYPLPPLHGIDFTYPASPTPHSAAAALPWLLQVLAVVDSLTAIHPLRVFIVIIPCLDMHDDTSALTAATRSHYVSSTWSPRFQLLNTAACGDLVCSYRWLVVASQPSASDPSETILSIPAPSDCLQAAYGPLVLSPWNTRQHALLALRADTLAEPPALPVVPVAPCTAASTAPCFVPPIVDPADRTALLATLAVPGYATPASDTAACTAVLAVLGHATPASETAACTAVLAVHGHATPASETAACTAVLAAVPGSVTPASETAACTAVLAVPGHATPVSETAACTAVLAAAPGSVTPASETAACTAVLAVAPRSDTPASLAHAQPVASTPFPAAATYPVPPPADHTLPSTRVHMLPTPTNLRPQFALPLAIARVQLASPAPPCFVYHPDHPMPELLDDAAAATSLFGHSFGIPFTDSLGVLQTRQLRWVEILPAYCPTLAALSPPVQPTFSLLADLRRSLAPLTCTALCSESLAGLLQYPTASPSTAIDVARCFTTAAHPLPAPSVWASAYAADSATQIILTHLASGAPWNPSAITALPTAFQQFARDDRMCIHHGRLVVRQSLQSGNSLLLIVVPATLRRLLFDIFHGSPIGGHFGVYKTLFRIRMRFFWPFCRRDVTAWIQSCAHCILTDKSIRRHSEVLFSWPVTAPMFVLHCDLWSPGTIVADSGDTHLLSAMCDLTQFVISVPVSATHSHELARTLFQDILLKVGMCGLIVVDAGSSFCGVFAAACALLGIKYHAASRGNHKAVSVERFFRYLNKAVTLASSDRGTPLVWIEASMIATYAWNCSPIDGTDVIRSVPAMGREFRFPFDLTFDADSPAASPLPDASTAILDYIKQTSTHVDFARRVVELVIADRRTAHRDRVNEGRSAPSFKIDDLVLVRVQVQSNAELHRVAKLSYQVRGPFRIVSHSAGSYQVTPLHNPTADPLSYPGHMLSPVPSGIMPCQPVDSPDFRYLNHGHAPLPNPLKRHLNIEQYNEIWFTAPPAHRPTYPARTTQPATLIDHTDTTPFPSLASMNVPPDPALPELPSAAPVLSPALLATALATSTDRLFFISYIPAGTARPRWYLVRVDLNRTESDPDCPSPLTSGIYHAHFLLQHPADSHMGHPLSRWWPQWNRFTINPADNIMDYGPIHLCSPNTTPDPSKFVAWSTAISLSDPACYLAGPLDFQPRLLASDRRNTIAAPAWDALFSLCQSRGIIPPSLSPTSSPRWLSRSASARRKRTRFR
jgi:hypothetical protein